MWKTKGAEESLLRLREFDLMNSWRNHPTIFISHSSEDILLGRAARNVLEDLDHHVLLLGLLQDMTEYEVLALLDKEIRARDWLLLIDSEDSRRSSWVKFERERANEYGKELFRIDVERFATISNDRHKLEKAIQPCINSFSRGIRIFPSYSNQDREIVSVILNYLISRKYQVWNPLQDLRPGMNWMQEIKHSIEESSTILVFLSERTVNSQFVLHELQQAISSEKTIVPIFLGPETNIKLPDEIRHLLWYQIDNLTDDRWKAGIIEALERSRQYLISRYCE